MVKEEGGGDQVFSSMFALPEGGVEEKAGVWEKLEKDGLDGRSPSSPERNHWSEDATFHWIGSYCRVPELHPCCIWGL